MNKKAPVVYIAGPMTGLPGLNRKAFFEAETQLRGQGCKVMNPAVLPIDLPAKCYMPICLAMLMQCDEICLLPGWEQSEGACAEHEVAMYQGIKVRVMDGGDAE